jgi:hypothetical protein
MYCILEVQVSCHPQFSCCGSSLETGIGQLVPIQLTFLSPFLSAFQSLLLNGLLPLSPFARQVDHRRMMVWPDDE